MKDSKEKEHRISNLKDMIHNIKEDNAEFSELDYEDDDEELMDYLNEETEDYEEFEIDDEYIYRPGDENVDAVNLEENPIDDDFIINAPAEKEIEENKEETEEDEFSEDMMGDVSESFDYIVNAKIGRTPILGVVSTLLGLILIVLSVFIFQSRADRVIDHVVSGETNFIFIIVLALGLVLFIYGIFKVFRIRSPFKSFTDSIDSIDKESKDDTSEDMEEPDSKVIPKSNIPLDKESYKIGEFEMDDLKNKLKKPTSSDQKPQPAKKKLDDIPPAKEKEDSKKEMTSKEIEEKEYEQVQLEGESIDEIFAEIEELDEIPIISIDSEEKDDE